MFERAPAVAVFAYSSGRPCFKPPPKFTNFVLVAVLSTNTQFANSADGA
jgi:hypothetical protein